MLLMCQLCWKTHFGVVKNWFVCATLLDNDIATEGTLCIVQSCMVIALWWSVHHL